MVITLLKNLWLAGSDNNCLFSALHLFDHHMWLIDLQKVFSYYFAGYYHKMTCAL